MICPRAYEGNEPYIFVSYAHKDSERVLPIISALQERGFRIWYDAGIEAGTEWPEYIAEHLDRCSSFLAFMSEHAQDSHNCRREINFAIELRKEPLVIYLEDVQMSLGMRMQLGSLQAIFYNRHSNLDSFIAELCRSRVLDACRDGRLQVHTVARSTEEAYHKGNECSFRHAYKEAVKWYRQAAEQGHTEAQVKLGECYRRGWGVAKNRAEAMIWYRNAAGNGNTDAMMALGNCYHSEGNNIEAVKWYRHAAEQGDVVAQHQLGECYSYGVGVEKDDTEAAKWYRAAAEKGHTESQNALGDCLYYGEGVAEDVTEAAEWYRKAAEKGDCSAQYMLETIGIVW